MLHLVFYLKHRFFLDFIPPQNKKIQQMQFITSAALWPAGRDFFRLALLVAPRQTVHRTVWSPCDSPRSSNPTHFNLNNKQQMYFSTPAALWPAGRDSNPRSSESESDALSGYATGGYYSGYIITIYHKHVNS